MLFVFLLLNILFLESAKAEDFSHPEPPILPPRSKEIPTLAPNSLPILKNSFPPEFSLAWKHKSNQLALLRFKQQSFYKNKNFAVSMYNADYSSVYSALLEICQEKNYELIASVFQSGEIVVRLQNDKKLLIFSVWETTKNQTWIAESACLSEASKVSEQIFEILDDVNKLLNKRGVI